ncbi:phage holin family protein [Dactylosporangium sp. NPDC049140]|jgi:MFS family permease|uniref:phage holin family protein n=1 Tax=Dactylosporangium sp. NPDC049140 TaxID=3155647 RepID=UPI0033ED92A0
MTSTLENRPAVAPRVQNPITGTTTHTGDRSTAELVKLAAEQISTLVRDELKLAQIELTAKGKRAGLGVGMFGGAGVIAMYGVGALLAALIIGLAAVMPAWLAALIVGVALFIVAGVLALVGKGQVKRAVPAMPEETVAGVKADIDTITSSVKHGGHK